MKKLLVVAVLVLLAVALVACGGEETPATTKGEDATTTPVATEPNATEPKATEPNATEPGTVTTTTPTTSTTVATSTTPGTTEYVLPVERVINELIADAWWNSVWSRKPISYSINDDGTKTFTWSLTIAAESGLFPYLPDDHPTTPKLPSLQLSTAEGARVFIKDVNKDEDYTEYTVSAWKTARWCDIEFVADGFVPTADGEYDMVLFFVMPEYSANPGDLVYVWALGDTWTYNAPVVSGNPDIDYYLEQGYHCTLHRHNEKYAFEHTNASKDPVDATLVPTPITADQFPADNFSFTVRAEDNLFPGLEGGQSFWNIEKEGAFVYIKGQDDTEYTRYDIDWMYLERWCDMWFTIDGFEPVAGEQYDMYVFFMSGVGATHPNTYHYVHATDWMAGAPVEQ